jgi:hypothetical protein
MNDLVKLIMEAYGLPQKQAIIIAGSVTGITERQGYEAMDSKESASRRDAVRAGTMREFNPNKQPVADPALGRQMIAEDVGDLSRYMGNGGKPGVAMFAGLTPGEMAQAVGGAGDQAYMRKKYMDSVMLSRRVDQSLIDANNKNLAEARKRGNLPKNAILIDPDAELPTRPEWNDPAMQLIPLAPVTKSEEEKLRDRLFPRMY